MFFLEKLDENQHKIVTALKTNKLLLNENSTTKVCNIVKKKISPNNALHFCTLARLYKLDNVYEQSLRYVERCFQMVVKSQNFLYLDFNLLAKILLSSELNIHSEVEIFNAVISWLENNPEENIKYAKQLLRKVRVSLLSEHACNYVSNLVSSLSKSSDCMKLLKTFLDNNDLYQYKSRVNNTIRYCNQNNYKLLICGGQDKRLGKIVRKVQQLDGVDMKSLKNLTPMINERFWFQAVCLNREVYVFDGINNDYDHVRSVEKFTPTSNNWMVVTDLFDERYCYCVCSFMDKIYILGGKYENEQMANSCMQFDAKLENQPEKFWKVISGMNAARWDAACADFQGNIVVSGGIDAAYNGLKTVEKYDVFADEWTPMSDMMSDHEGHSLVTVKNKLFVIADENNKFEVFDNVCKKFVFLTHASSVTYRKGLPLGEKIIFFKEFGSSVLCYDVRKDKWSEKSFEVTTDLKDFACLKLPWY